MGCYRMAPEDAASALGASACGGRSQPVSRQPTKPSSQQSTTHLQLLAYYCTPTTRHCVACSRSLIRRWKALLQFITPTSQHAKVSDKSKVSDKYGHLMEDSRDEVMPLPGKTIFAANPSKTIDRARRWSHALWRTKRSHRWHACHRLCAIDCARNGLCAIDCARNGLCVRRTASMDCARWHAHDRLCTRWTVHVVDCARG